MQQSEKMRIGILIVEDQELVRVGLKTVLDKVDGFHVVGLARDGNEAVDLASAKKPDVVLMDIGLPFLNGIDAAKRIKDFGYGTKIVMLTSHDDEQHVFAALGAGAEGYCLKESSGHLLVNAIVSVSEGAAWLDPGIAQLVLKTAKAGKIKDMSSGSNSELLEILTKRELEVLEKVVEGRTNQEIANDLYISIETVKTHMRHIMEKLRVTDRTQAAVKAMKEGLF